CTVNVVLCTRLALMVSTSLFTCFFSPRFSIRSSAPFSSNIRTANFGISSTGPSQRFAQTPAAIRRNWPRDSGTTLKKTRRRVAPRVKL
ncbi:hypothetical protein B0H14DRAFT_2801868, partial [Mycena olivaceomarginata]